jgi:hypothetical protein
VASPSTTLARLFDCVEPFGVSCEGRTTRPNRVMESLCWTGYTPLASYVGTCSAPSIQSLLPHTVGLANAYLIPFPSGLLKIFLDLGTGSMV